ncbi:hypothetical protein JOD20_004376 [Herpetosiphon giganteus]|nr:hypothetical protein [Herpetosiphon giganteus]
MLYPPLRYQHSPQGWFCLFFGREDDMLSPGETTGSRCCPPILTRDADRANSLTQTGGQR